MNFRTRFQRFLLRNRDKGIPNLMLYIVLGNAVVSLMSMLHGGEFLSQLLYFDKHLILQGQVGGCSPLYLPSPAVVSWG